MSLVYGSETVTEIRERRDNFYGEISSGESSAEMQFETDIRLWREDGPQETVSYLVRQEYDEATEEIKELMVSYEYG